MKTLEVNWEELGISNDFLFGKVMRNPGLCKEMLEIILEIEIERLEYPETQKSIDEDKDARSIRLDVYVKDEKGTVFNIEIQTTDSRNLPKRTRYYQSMIDLQSLNKGEFYKNLNRSYIIFICTFDPFKTGRYVYTFENRCREDENLTLGDEAYKVFLNTEGFLGNVNRKLKAFLDYVGGRTSDDEFVRRLEDEVKKAKKNREWRSEYMTLAMRDQENRAEAKEEGRAEEREQGVKVLIETCREVGVSEDIIELKLMQKYSLSEEEAKDYLNQF